MTALPVGPPPKVFVIANTRQGAASWIADNALAFHGVDVKACSLPEAGIRLRGAICDRIYVVSGAARESSIDLGKDPMLEASAIMALSPSGGEIVNVGPLDRIEPIIIAVCDHYGCPSHAKVVVHNESGMNSIHVPACPGHASEYVGKTTVAIYPLIGAHSA